MNTRNTNAATQITVQPLNPDNEFHLRHVATLFERANMSYGSLNAVRSSNYWKLAASKKFTPLLAIHCNKVVAHCGLGTSGRSPSTGVIFHPAIDPQFTALSSDIATEFERVIDSQARRRNLSSLLHFGSGEREADSLLAQMGFAAVAELQNDSGSHEVSMRLIDTRARSVEFVPPALRKQVTQKYTALGIRSGSVSSGDAMPLPFPADDAAVDIIPLARMGRALVFVNASLLVGTSLSHRLPHGLMEALRRWPRAIVCVNMADHGCTRMAELLKANQFQFKGVLPAVRGRDSILFARGFNCRPYIAESEIVARRKNSAI